MPSLILGREKVNVLSWFSRCELPLAWDGCDSLKSGNHSRLA